jgi:3',5'-cyclic AMP phosphodiesterase CpdA
MRRIVHLSDIHFGRVDHAVAARVIEKVNELSPDLVVVSGDLTQRAKSEQFIDARRFLDSLPRPQIVVPGNHDVPLYNVFARFGSPLRKFRKYITDDLAPSYSDGEMAVVGVNTARSLTIKGGRINEEQIEQVRDKMCGLHDDVLKVVVTHHPFDLPIGHSDDDIVGRAEKAMPLMADCGADVFLAGHLHVSHVGDTAKRYKLENGKSSLVVQAGTATSVRGRGEANSFNLIVFERPSLTVHRLECASPADGFDTAETQTFRQTATGWARTV